MPALPMVAAALAVALSAAKPAAPPPPPDVRAPKFGAAEPLAVADRAFDAAVAAKDRATFSGLLDEAAVFGTAGGMAEGREKVAAAWARWFDPASPWLRWAPERAVVAASGDLGYTIGRWRLSGKGKDGKPIADEGRYLTVWRKGADGGWRACFDLSWEPPNPGEEVARTPTRELASSDGGLVARAGTWRRAGPGAGKGGFLTVLRRDESGRLVPEVDTVVRIGD